MAQVTRRLTGAAGRQWGGGECAPGWLAYDLAGGAVAGKETAVAVGAEIGVEERNVEGYRLAGNKLR